MKQINFIIVLMLQSSSATTCDVTLSSLTSSEIKSIKSQEDNDQKASDSNQLDDKKHKRIVEWLTSITPDKNIDQ